MEEVDNKARKNNLQLKGLKEGVEDLDLEKYLETLLNGCLASDTEAEICLSFANRVGVLGNGHNKNRDKDVILGLLNGDMKRLVWDSLWGKPKIVEEGQQLTFYLDLCPFTLHRRRQWGFLTTKLNSQGIAYKWGFSHKCLLDYKGKIVMIRTILQAEMFENKIVVVDSEILRSNFKTSPFTIWKGASEV